MTQSVPKDKFAAACSKAMPLSLASALQVGGEPEGAATAEAARAAAMAAGDFEAAARAEAALLAALLGAQFGPAHVEPAQGLIMVQVRTGLAMPLLISGSEKRVLKRGGLEQPILI